MEEDEEEVITNTQRDDDVDGVITDPDHQT